ncbi:hypothetical protein ABN034_33525 [Actinopolymorpha sp. B11F2]|uniref:hypothetical protein n=1 Tax=Actinopolymorpha sp. B11F2 TaxID=3160862 RepID=UPI0032E3F578
MDTPADTLAAFVAVLSEALYDHAATRRPRPTPKPSARLKPTEGRIPGAISTVLEKP